MSISAPFIARPVATSLLAVAILLIGVLGYRALPVSSLPQVDFPTIQVVTQLPGASPDTVSKLITAPLERQFGEIAGLAAMNSISSQGTSTITLRFELSMPQATAAQDVQAAINAASGTLPPNLQYPPVYNQVNPADAPILTLALTSQTIPLYQVADTAQTMLLQKLAEVAGVGQVTIEGGLRKAIRINVNPVQLAAYGISLEDVRNAVANANQAGAKGGLQGAHQAYAIGANDQITAAEEYRGLVVAYRNQAPVRLSAVGTVTSGLENDQELASYNGTPAVLMDIQRQPGANIVSTVQRIEAALGAQRGALPPGIDLQIVANRTGTIEASVRDVQITLITSALLVVLVIFLFLPNPRAVLIPAVALPLSIIATFAVMSELGYQLDNLSLMALTVASGFVVDDAIVMIENVVRFIEAGEPPLRAAYLGAAQIGFTIVSLTVSLIAVFIPLLFMPGIVGRLFSEFAVTLSVAVVISAVVSLTLTPMMSARLLRPAGEARPGRIARGAEAALTRTRDAYGRGLAWCIRHERLMLVVFAATVAITLALFVVVPKALLPQEDTGEIVAVTQGRQSASLDAMQRLQDQAIAAIRRNPAVAGVTSLLGAGVANPTPNTGQLTIVLKPFGTRPALASVMTQLQQALAHVVGLTFYMQPVQDITLSSRVSPTQYQVHADGYQPAGAGRLGRQDRSGAAVPAAAQRRRERSGERGAGDLHRRRSRRRRKARRHHVGDRERALRRLRPAPDHDDLRAERAVPGGARDRPEARRLARRAGGDLRPRRQPDERCRHRRRRPGLGGQRHLHHQRDGGVGHCDCADPVERGRADRRAARTAGDHAGRPVPLGDAQLQPRPRRLARRGRAGDHDRAGQARRTGVRQRGVLGRGGGIPVLARRYAVADPGGAGGDLHRARRAL